MPQTFAVRGPFVYGFVHPSDEERPSNGHPHPWSSSSLPEMLRSWNTEPQQLAAVTDETPLHSL
jgi:hypothetical protein